jgi:SAM-dependent methyltransferase
MTTRPRFMHPKTGVEHSGEKVDSANGYDIIDCEVCGFRHVIPIPTPEELDELYRNTYYLDDKPNYFKEAQEDQEWLNATHANYYGILEELLEENERSLLEIGSGPGHFLAIGKERGWKVVGFEPSTLACEHSRKSGVETINGPFDESLAREWGPFDVVYMNDVLEHLPDPVSTLRSVTEVLNPQGLLFIISPNDYSPLQRILRESFDFGPYWLAPPQHLSYFNFESVERLLDRLGFDVVDALGTYPMEFFLLSGRNYIGDNEVGRTCHSERKEFECSLYSHAPNLLNNYFRYLASEGIGRQFVIVARKKDRLKNHPSE